MSSRRCRRGRNVQLDNLEPMVQVAPETRRQLPPATGPCCLAAMTRTSTGMAASTANASDFPFPRARAAAAPVRTTPFHRFRRGKRLPPSACSKISPILGARIGKCSPFVTEKLVFKQVLRNGSAVQHFERAFAARAVVMQGPWATTSFPTTAFAASPERLPGSGAINRMRSRNSRIASERPTRRSCRKAAFFQGGPWTCLRRSSGETGV